VSGRWAVRIAAVGALCAAVVATSVPPAGAQATTPTTPYSSPPKAYIVIDQATGAVLSASNERTPLPPASLTKILTALVTVAALGPTASVPISSVAAGMPARKLNMKAGQVWPVGDVLSSLLASSANDAGAALAERVSGSLEDFDLALRKLARHLQLADAPTLRDPSGLDDNFSVGGGNLISARDLAIAARAVLANDRLASIVATPVIRFTGPDGIPHRLTNHNKMLTQYAGTIGMKTGFTRKAGRGLIAAATRNGRTQIAVLLNVGDTYGWAAQLLDAAFAQPIPGTGDRLPAIPPALKLKPANIEAALGVVADPAEVQTVPVSSTSSSGLPAPVRFGLYLMALLGAAWTVLRARVVIRRNRRRRRRKNAQVRRHVHRRRDPQLTPHYKVHEDMAERFHTAARK
jgi:serine-type D-Ala-D-Ala carboxypeptidase (penicillin-binding protein 5/6)